MIQPSIVADLAPAIQSREAADPETYPAETMRNLFESGVIGGPLAVANGGSGWTLAETTAAVEALARASGSAALISAMPMGLSGVYAIPPDAIPAEHRRAGRTRPSVTPRPSPVAALRRRPRSVVPAARSPPRRPLPRACPRARSGSPATRSSPPAAPTPPCFSPRRRSIPPMSPAAVSLRCSWSRRTGREWKSSPTGTGSACAPPRVSRCTTRTPPPRASSVTRTSWRRPSPCRSGTHSSPRCPLAAPALSLTSSALPRPSHPRSGSASPRPSCATKPRRPTSSRSPASGAPQPAPSSPPGSSAPRPTSPRR